MSNPLINGQNPLPPRPDFLNAHDRARLNPSLKLAPQQKRAALAVLAVALEKQLKEHKALQPITVWVDTRPDGFSLHVDVPAMTGGDDISVPGGSGT